MIREQARAQELGFLWESGEIFFLKAVLGLEPQLSQDMVPFGNGIKCK